MTSLSESEIFLCPECGGSNPGMAAMVSPNEDGNDPWCFVLSWIQCSDCNSVIPSHLAELWDGLSSEAAAEEWRSVYRDTMPDLEG